MRSGGIGRHRAGHLGHACKQGKAVRCKSAPALKRRGVSFRTAPGVAGCVRLPCLERGEIKLRRLSSNLPGVTVKVLQPPFISRGSTGGECGSLLRSIRGFESRPWLMILRRGFYGESTTKTSDCGVSVRSAAAYP